MQHGYTMDSILRACSQYGVLCCVLAVVMLGRKSVLGVLLAV
jgi:hypothetical protein